MVFDRFARALPILVTAVALAGCVTIAPGASPTAPPTAVVTASPAPTATMTGAPTLPPTLPPTQAPTEPPTAPPTDVPTTPPTDKPTTPPTTEPTAPPEEATLDPNLDSRYGSEELDPGFEPDPAEVAVISGGPIDARYLGGDCVGFAEPNPDYEVHFSAGGSFLRFYFVAGESGGDATLIINDPNSQWNCNDDSYGTPNPTVGFDAPDSGLYDIWIGSFSADAFVSGTLYITEIDLLHP